MITQQQVEKLMLELLQNQQFSVKRTTNGLEIVRGNNIYAIAASSAFANGSQITRR